MSWKTVHAGSDDPDDMPGHVAEAEGVTFDPPVPITEVQNVLLAMGKAASTYVKAVIEANDRLVKAMPAEGPLRQIAMARLEKTLKKHANEKGQTIAFVQSEQRTPETKSPEWTNQHRELVKKLKVGKDFIPESDLSRAMLLKTCENVVLQHLKKAGERLNIRVTPRMLQEIAKDAHPEIHEMIQTKLLATLVNDGWVLYQVEEEIRVLPYGQGVPCYDPAKEKRDHPAWSRDPKSDWTAWTR